MCVLLADKDDVELRLCLLTWASIPLGANKRLKVFTLLCKTLASGGSPGNVPPEQMPFDTTVPPGRHSALGRAQSKALTCCFCRALSAEGAGLRHRAPSVTALEAALSPAARGFSSQFCLCRAARLGAVPFLLPHSSFGVSKTDDEKPRGLL